MSTIGLQTISNILIGSSRTGAEISRLNALENALLEFGEMRFSQLARKVVYRFRRIPATAIYGNWEYRSLWDQYCYDFQFGPHEDEDIAAGYLDFPPSWERVFDPVLERLVSELPESEKKVLLFVTDRYFLAFDEEESDFYVDDDDIILEIKSRLAEAASDRDLSKYCD